MQEVLDDMSVEVDKPHEGLDFSHIPQGHPVVNTHHLDGIHLHLTFQKNEAKILYCGLLECALLGLKVELMLVEDVNDPHYNGVVLLLGLAVKDEDVIHHYL